MREGVRNGTTSSETEIIGKLDAQTGKGGFVTRQSNTATGPKAGGAVVYGCRAPLGGTASGSAPCIRASNLANGNAFEFAAAGGPVAGLISVGNPAVPNPSAAPFTTNATGVATGLNADKVDGKDASELVGATGPTGPAGAPGAPGAPGTPGPSGTTQARVSQGALLSVPACAATAVGGCTNLISRTLGAGSWVIQAKLEIDNNGGAAASTTNSCGIAQGAVVLDEARNSLGPNFAVGQNEVVALMAVVTDVPAGTTIGLRCTEQGGESLQALDLKLIAVQVQSVVGP